jgi:hypothetical protein
MSRREAAHFICRLVMNAIKSLRREPQLDRRGRFAGHLIGLRAILAGTSEPERAATL